MDGSTGTSRARDGKSRTSRKSRFSEMETLTLSRRSFVTGAATLTAGLVFTPALRAAEAAAGPPVFDDAARAALAASPLVYISPLRSDGQESRCHAEVWFVTDGEDVLVVTNPERWRAAAIGKGLSRARLWVGDHGVWKDSGGAFRSAPTYLAAASLESDPAVHARALVSYGRRYPDSWSKWGPRFESGLASGERVMIRYRAVRTKP